MLDLAQLVHNYLVEVIRSVMGWCYGPAARRYLNDVVTPTRENAVIFKRTKTLH